MRLAAASKLREVRCGDMNAGAVIVRRVRNCVAGRRTTHRIEPLPRLHGMEYSGSKKMGKLIAAWARPD